jgi:hypothetical protein
MGEFALINYFYNLLIFIQPDGADVFAVNWFRIQRSEVQRSIQGSGFSVQRFKG